MGDGREVSGGVVSWPACNWVTSYVRSSVFIPAGPPQEVAITALLDRFASERDSDAFAALVARSGPIWSWPYCRGVLCDPVDVEDAFQATFLILARRVGSLHRVQGWLGGIPFTAWPTALLSGPTSMPRELPGREKLGSGSFGCDRRTRQRTGRWLELRSCTRSCARLPEAMHRAVVLCDLEGMTQLEAAQELGCGEATFAAAAGRGPSASEEAAGTVRPGRAVSRLARLGEAESRAGRIDRCGRPHRGGRVGRANGDVDRAGRLAAAVLGAMTPRPAHGARCPIGR